MSGLAAISRFSHQLKTLQHAEAMLLVYDDQAEVGEFHFFLEQRMRADHELRVTLRDVSPHFTLAVRFERAGEENNAVACVFKNSARGKIVLLRQNFSRRHERDLASVFDGDDGRLETHDGLPR